MKKAITVYSFYVVESDGSTKLFGAADNIPQRNEIHHELKESGRNFKIVTTYPSGSVCVSEHKTQEAKVCES